MKTILLLITSLLVATNWVSADEAPNLDDPKVREKILKGALLRDTLEERGPEGAKLFYAPDNQQPPFPRPPVRPNGWLRGLPPKANS